MHTHHDLMLYMAMLTCSFIVVKYDVGVIISPG